MRIPFFGLFVFILFLYLELSAFEAFADAFGGGVLFFEIIGTFFFGSYVGREVFSQLKQGLLRPESILSILGALLLMLPGLITDVVGLLLSLSFIREKLNPHFTRSGAMNYTKDTFFKDRFYEDDTHQKQTNSPIIDAEFHEVDPNKPNKE